MTLKLKKYSKNTEYYNIVTKLRKEKRLNNELELLINNLSLEDLIALKLTLSTRITSGRIYGLPLLNVLPSIVKSAVIKYVCSSSFGDNEAASYLGVGYIRFIRMLSKYDLLRLFSKKKLSRLELKENLKKIDEQFENDFKEQFDSLFKDDDLDKDGGELEGE